MHRQPAREPPGGDSSIRPEELPYAVGQLERLGPVDRTGPLCVRALVGTKWPPAQPRRFRTSANPVCVPTPESRDVRRRACLGRQDAARDPPSNRSALIRRPVPARRVARSGSLKSPTAGCDGRDLAGKRECGDSHEHRSARLREADAAACARSADRFHSSRSTVCSSSTSVDHAADGGSHTWLT